MTEIINAGDKLVNRWMFPCDDGYCLIDTGFEKSYGKFKEKLKELNIELKNIKYVVITHMHSDHVGFLKKLLADTEAMLIYDASDKRRLEAGKNNLNTYVSRFEYLVLSRISTLFIETTQCFPAVFYNNYADAKTQPLADYGVEFMFLKGHTECDLCVKFENKIFCGDLCMNGLGASRRAPTWIYNKYDMLTSWAEIMNSGAEYVYPGHGKPFKTSSLKSASEFWKTRGVLRLYANKR